MKLSKSLRRLVSSVISLALILQTLAPTTVYAADPVATDSAVIQIPTPTPEVVPTPTETIAPTPIQILTPTDTPTTTPTPEIIPEIIPTPESTPGSNPKVPIPTPTETPLPTETLSPSPILEPTPTPIPIPTPAAVWQDVDSNTITTRENVAEGIDYRFKDDKVVVRFTKITKPGKLTIKQIKLTQDQVTFTRAISDTAYDVTSDMENGTFLYDLTLPLPQDEPDARVEFATDQNSLDQSQVLNANVTSNPDTISIKGLDHFTIFFVTSGEDRATNGSFCDSDDDGDSDADDDIDCNFNSNLPSLTEIDSDYLNISGFEATSSAFWPNLDYAEDRYVQLNFDNEIDPATLVLAAKIKLTYQTNEIDQSEEDSYGAKIVISDDDVFDEETDFVADITPDPTAPNTNQTFTVNLTEDYLDPSILSHLRVRFYFYGTPGEDVPGITTSFDQIVLVVPPPTPELVYPPTNSIIPASDAILDWTNVTDILGESVTYEYKSSWLGGNYGPVSTGTDSQIDATGSSDRTYDWQVRACAGSDNCSDWSGPWVVTIDGTPPDTLAPTATIDYSTTAPTNGSVVATLVPSETVTVTNNGGSDSYTFTENGTFTFEFVDNAGNTGTSLATVENIDQDPPEVSSLETQDNDHNGKIDAIKITLTKDIDDSRLEPGPDGWLVEGYGEPSIETGETENDNVLILGFPEGDTSDTAVRPNITYTPTGGPNSTHDLAGNELTLGTWTPDDTAAPVLVLATTKDDDRNGKIDTVIATLSEDVNGSSSTPADYEISDDYTIESETELGGVITLRLDEKAVANDTGTVLTLSLISGEGVGVKDLNGNWSYGENSVEVSDDAAPVSTASSPEFASDSPISVSFTASDFNTGTDESELDTTQLWYRYDGGDWIDSGLSSTGDSGTFDFVPEDGEGTYEFYTIAADNAGNIENDPDGADDQTIFDVSKPQSEITTPVNNGSNTVIYSNAWDGAISGTATDGQSGLDRVELSIRRTSDGKYYDGETWVEVEADEPRIPAEETESWSYLLTNVTEDTYEIVSHAVDNAGNVEDSYKLTVVFDKTIPEVSVSLDPVNPDGGNNWYKTEPTITLTATDNTVTDHLEYQWDSTTGVWTVYASPLKPPGEGNHTLYYRAFDNAGNVSDIGVKNIKYDKTDLTDGPKNVSVSPNPTSNTVAKVKWEAASDNVGIEKYEINWSLDGTTTSYTDTVGSDIREHEINKLDKEGKWNITVTAFDAAGNHKAGSTELTVSRNVILALTGTPGVLSNTPTEGFTEEVKGVTTLETPIPSDTPTPSVLGETSKYNFPPELVILFLLTGGLGAWAFFRRE